MRVIEGVLGAIIVAVLAVALIRFDAFDQLYHFTRAREDWQLDEIILVVLAAVFGSLVTAIVVVRRQARELKRTLATLGDALDEAAHARQSKNRFLMSMSHEFRTPLNAVMGFSELLSGDARNPLPPVQERYVQHIKASGDRLLHLVDDLIDLSRIDLNAFEVALEVVDARRLAQNCLDDVRGEADEAQLQVDFTAPDRVEVLANATKLRYVLKCLMVNAIRYNRPDGRVSVSVKSADDGRVAISVADTGVGIADAMIPRLFQPFDRLGHEGSATTGAGIGLTLSKRLVEAMSGTIEVASRKGVGSTFVVRLPAAPAGGARREGGAA